MKMRLLLFLDPPLGGRTFQYLLWKNPSVILLLLGLVLENNITQDIELR